MKRERMLILKASSDVEVCETDLIERVAGMYDVHVDVVDLRTDQDLDAIRAGSGNWDLVYACGHGDGDGIGDRQGDRFFLWTSIAAALCERLGDEAWFFLGCCRGGLDRVAYAMFCGCDNLDYVFGPGWKADARQLACAFHALMHNFTDRGVEPVRSAQRASEATDLTIRVFDRAEVEATEAFIRWCDAHWTEIDAEQAAAEAQHSPAATPTPAS